MKKLMIAALAVAAMGAFADNTCAPDEPVTPTLVYKYKATVKTPKGIGKYTAAQPGNVCNPDGGTAAASTVVRAKDKTKFAGWIYDCTATCDTVANGSVVAWDSKRKSQLAEAAIATDFIHVIGKKQSDAEWSFKLTGKANYMPMGDAAYDLQHAGFGKYSAKKGYYTSFSGNFAGNVDAVTYIPKAKFATADDCVPAGYWLCSDLKTLATDEAAVAYGCWSAKVSKSASKKFAKNGYLKTPKYVVVEAAAE